jgi:hypothetical protein
MKPTDHDTKTPTAANGFFATLCGLLRVRGTGAPKISRGSGVRTRLLLAVLATTLAGLAFSAAPALAASPEPPELRVEPTFATTASLDGVLNPHGTPSEAGTYQFSYRKQTVAGEDKCRGAGEKKVPAAPRAGDGVEHEELPPEVLTGLTSSTEYAACLVAKNAEGEATSSPVSFTTTVAAPAETPSVSVEDDIPSPASPATEAVFKGIVDPNAEVPVEPGTYEFVYRSSPASKDECKGLGEKHAPTSPGMSLGGPHEELPDETVTGLTAGSEYAVCLIVTKDDGEVLVSAATPFTTPVPPEAPVTGSPPKAITATSATFEGTLNPGKEAETGWYFAFSTGANCTSGGAGGGETTYVAPAQAKALAVPATEDSDLEPHQKYRVCLVAFNAAGEAVPGNEVSFETPVVQLTIAEESTSGVGSASATLQARINPYNDATTYEFEYATNEALSGATKVPGGSALEGLGGRIASVATGAVLAPGSTYYYRVLATNATHEHATGAVQSFTTPPTPHTDAVSEASASTATFNGHLTLDAVATSYSFAYKAEASGSECQGESNTNAVNVGSGSERAPVSSQVTGLAPGTRYAVCLLASNLSGREVGAAVVFTTPAVGAPELIVGSEYATEVASSSARLDAKVDPNGAETSYRVEYVSEAQFDAHSYAEASTAPQPEGAAGSGDGVVPLSVYVPELQPGTVYHYRFAAGNAVEQGVAGEDQTFTTLPPGTGTGSGGTFALPDNRQWELVSPPDKHGALIEPIDAYGLIESSAEGNAFTYITSAPTESQPQGNANATQNLATRGLDGWTSQDIATPNDTVTGVTIGNGQEYRFFSSDLSQALFESKFAGNAGFTTYPGEETSPYATEQTPYLRADSTCQATPATCYTPLLTEADVTSGDKFGGGQVERFGVGATPDLSHVVLHDEGVPWTKATSTTPEAAGLYEWSPAEPPAEQLQLVSVLPAAEGGGSAAGSIFGSHGEGYGVETRNAISSDGSRIVWTRRGALYMRDTALGETVRLDAVQGGSGQAPYSGAEPRFDIASSNGSVVFFTDTQQLTANSRAGVENEPDLYACSMVEVQEGGHTKLKCDLTDLTPDTNPGQERANVQGSVLAASKDGSYVYFVAGGVLAAGASPGADNLYFERYNGATEKWEAPTFIAAVSNTDANHDAQFGNLGAHTSGASPNGHYLAFMSDRDLTGYDTADANSGESDEEVYLYDAVTNKLVCASCNPTGARPDGERHFSAAPTEEEEQEEMRYVGGYDVWSSGQWLAANIPGWVSYTGKVGGHQPRYISNSGRLFFNSHEALVPQDVNGTWDVYEYEPPTKGGEGEGDCTTSTQSPIDVYDPKAEGCVGLISSGESSEESAFLDASENGGDVFFATLSQLVPQDVEHSMSVYDAHECTNLARCFPPAAETPPPCTTEASCKPAPESPPSIYGAPASATFSGAGNLAQPPPAVVKKVTTKKTVKCKKGDVKNKRGKCVKKSRKKVKKAKKSNGGASR